MRVRHPATLAIALSALTACGGVTQAQRLSDAGADVGGSASWDAGPDVPAETSAADAEAGSADAAMPCTHESDCPTGVPAKCGATCQEGKCVFPPAGVICSCPLGTGEDAGARGGACDGQGGCVVCQWGALFQGTCTDDSTCCVWYDPNSTNYNATHPYDYGMCGANHQCKMCMDPGHYCDQEHQCCTGKCTSNGCT
jgi:hypothetical protein